jgi:hypothetical protein
MRTMVNMRMQRPADDFVKAEQHQQARKQPAKNGLWQVNS